MDLNTSDSRQLTFDPLFTETMPEFTPDGKHVLYSSNRSAGGVWYIGVDGTGRWELVHGMTTLDVSNDGFEVLSPDSGFYNLFGSLVRGTVSGLVTLEDGKTPASGLTVELSQAGSVKFTTVSNPNGAFQIMNVLPGDYDVVAGGDHYKASDPLFVAVESLRTATCTLEVTRLPSATILSPAQDLEKNEQVIVETVVDDPQTDSVKFYARQASSSKASGPAEEDWTLLGSAAQAPYNLAWDLSSLAEGQYEIKAVAEKAGNLVDNSPDITTLVVDKTAPTVQITSPANGAELTADSCIVEATSPDEDVEEIVFEYRMTGSESWTRFGFAPAAPYRATFIPNDLIPTAEYHLRARASDSAGNVSESESVAITFQGPIPDETATATPTFSNTPTQTPTNTPTPSPQVTPLPADLDGNGVIDGEDLFIFSRGWFRDKNETDFLGDLTGDGFLDERDLLRFIEEWISEPR
jgi:hypothetical protein